MFKGFYTAASGMLAQQRKTEMLSNNMANVRTPGYKADQASLRAFPQMLLQRLDAASIPTDDPLRLTSRRQIGTLNTGVYLQELTPSFVQGDLRETGLKTDLALLNGPGGTAFFTVEQNGELKYTRNGSFTLDPSGYLTVGDGSYVLSREGARIRLSSDQFTVGADGVIMENGVRAAQLGLAESDNPEGLVREGNGLFRTEDNAPLPALAGGAEIRQGFLEASNVDASRTMTDMLTAYRTFEANQKLVQAYDRSMEKAVNEIGRVNG